MSLALMNNLCDTSDGSYPDLSVAEPRTATLHDLPILLALAEEFILESAWGWKFNKANSEKILGGYILSEETEVIMTDDSFSMVAFDDEFHDERLGYVGKFYVAPRARGTKAGRALIQANLEWFKKNNCAEVFATATANINSQGNSFKNLLTKFNFSTCGDTMVTKL